MTCFIATQSDLEELFIRFADKAGLPRPETNVYVEGPRSTACGERNG